MRPRATWLNGVVIVSFVCSIMVLTIPGLTASNADGKHSRVHVKALRPSSDTEVVLDEITLATNEQNRTRLIMRGSLKSSASKNFYYVVDPRTSEYEIVKLTGNHDRDAKKIQHTYKKHGVDISDSLMANRLSERATKLEETVKSMYERISATKALARSMPARDIAPRYIDAVYRPPAHEKGDDPMRPLQTLDLKRAHHGPPADTCRAGASGGRIENVQFSDFCYGYGWADIQTWEPAKYFFDVDHLSETNVGAYWTRMGSRIIAVEGDGACWSNPYSFFGTVWATVDCIDHSHVMPTDNFDMAKTGLYGNDNFVHQFFWNFFGIETEAHAAIYTTETVGVDYANGSASWSTQREFDGNRLAEIESYLLSGPMGGDAAEVYCTQVCDPSPADLEWCFWAGGMWDDADCMCVNMGDPLILDLENDGLSLTDIGHGVSFDLMSTGAPIKMAWTSGDGADAFVALDRNGNGTIDDGRELFSDLTPQADLSDHRKKIKDNGFQALAVFDQKENGGNDDREITEEDAVFSSLRLWVDANHNGLSEHDELKSLDECGVRSISLRYVMSKATDQFGNTYRYRSHALMDRDLGQLGAIQRRAVNVFLRYRASPPQ
jgi:hypothetical protein